MKALNESSPAPQARREAQQVQPPGSYPPLAVPVNWEPQPPVDQGGLGAVLPSQGVADA